MLPARFHQIRDRAVAAVDRTFAEPVRFSPMLNGQTDPERPQIVIEAILRTEDKGEVSVSGSQGRTAPAAVKAQLHIDRARYPALAVVGAIRAGDVVRALSRPGEPAFEAAFVDGRHHVRLVVELTERK